MQRSPGVRIINYMAKTPFYKGNTNIPVANIEHEWTPEMVDMLVKAKEDIQYFAENFFYIVSLDEGKRKIKLYDAQRRILDSIVQNLRVCLLASRQIGKALALDTPIPTPAGWTTMGELNDGDVIYGGDGKTCTVVKAHDVRYNRNCYKVEFSDGECIVADEDHNWFTQTCLESRKNCKGSVKTTKQILDTLLFNKIQPNHFIPILHNNAGAENNVDLPIDPYILGTWLGDGGSHNPGRIHVNFREAEELRAIVASKLNIMPETMPLAENTGVAYFTVKNLCGPTDELSLRGNKHIPVSYLHASREQKLELIRGLMDTDGTYAGDRHRETGKYANVCFTQANYNIAFQVYELVTSLGWKATLKEFGNAVGYNKHNKNATCWRVIFRPTEQVFHLQRKRDYFEPALSRGNQSKKRFIKSITPIESVPVRCITVDSPDSLFLCGKSHVATHNTTVMTIYALWVACFQPDKRILLLANKEKTAIQIFSRIRLAYEMLPAWIKPGVDGEYGKTQMKLANGSSIGVSATSSSSIRGDSANCVDGNTVVTIRAAQTNTVFDVTLSQLEQLLLDNGELPIKLIEQNESEIVHNNVLLAVSNNNE